MEDSNYLDSKNIVFSCKFCRREVNVKMRSLEFRTLTCDMCLVENKPYHFDVLSDPNLFVSEKHLIIYCQICDEETKIPTFSKFHRSWMCRDCYKHLKNYFKCIQRYVK